MKKISLIFSLFISSVFAFTKGSGSEFIFQSNNKNLPLSIYFTEVSNTNLSVEFHFAVNDIFMKNMWQQYKLSRTTGAIKVEEGFIKTGKLKDVERMSVEDLNINEGKGVELNQFLFSEKAQFDKYYIADETVEVPAGSIVAKHYRQEKNGQRVDFWISDIVKPIGLVKLISKSSKTPSQNYSLELSSLLKNVAAEIDPKKAKNLSEQTKNLLKQEK